MPRYLETPEPAILQEHDYYVTKQQIYNISKETVTIDTEYADDIGKNILYQYCNTINKGKQSADYYKTTIPEELKNRDLKCYPDKTEQYTITRNGDQSWKSCKYLGTLLDTPSDITRRKHLTMNAMTKLKHLWESNKVTLATKRKCFDACIRSVFM